MHAFLKNLLQWKNDFVGLIYPRLCLACREEQPPVGQPVCVYCMQQMKPTNLHLQPLHNPLRQKLSLIQPIRYAAAAYYFKHGGPERGLIHSFKYYGRPELGIWLGKQYGNQLKQTAEFREVQAIVPVPMNIKKQLQRGYNQAERFAQGLVESLQVPCYQEALQKTRMTEAQAKRTLKQRLAADQPFEINKSQDVVGKHILLVDDVITTGTTMMACAKSLCALPNTQVSIVAIAVGRRI